MLDRTEPEDFVRRRHGELQKAGRANSEIFAQIATELQCRRFRAPRLGSQVNGLAGVILS